MLPTAPYGSGTPFALRCSRSCESVPHFLTSGRSLHSRPKPKNLPIFCVPPPTPSRLKKRRKGFLVLVRRFILQKATFNLHLFESFHFVFFRLHADPRRSAFECSSEIQPTLTIPPSPRIGTLAFACVACSVVAGVRFF